MLSIEPRLISVRLVYVKIPKNWNFNCRLNSIFKSIPQFGKFLGILQLHIHILRQATVTNKWLSYIPVALPIQFFLCFTSIIGASYPSK